MSVPAGRIRPEERIQARTKRPRGNRPIAPFADLDQEPEVAHELIVHDVVVPAVGPEHVGPFGVDLARELCCGVAGM